MDSFVTDTQALVKFMMGKKTGRVHSMHYQRHMVSSI